MALFRNKPPAAVPARPVEPPKPGKQPKAAKQPKPGKVPKPPKPAKLGKISNPPKPAKHSKGSVNSADFIALRFEMVDLRARLEASEQSKAIVETRLAALDAGNEMARRPHEGGEVRHRIDEVEAQLGAIAAAAAAASATAAGAAAKAAAAADALVEAQNFARPDPKLGARVDELTSRIDAVADASRLRQVEAQIDDLAAKIAAPPPVALLSPDKTDTNGTDSATAARLDEISARVESIDSLAGQLAQLNARVTAQAEFGAQLSSLSDRIGELSNGSRSFAPASQPIAEHNGLGEQVQALSYRVEVLAERVETGDARARQTAEQLSTIEHRMSAVSTELTNQVSELGRDIDDFGGLANSNGNGEGDGHSGNGKRLSAELLSELQSAQIKLAEEQARYEIAFRQDLATLAEHVRRAKGG